MTGSAKPKRTPRRHFDEDIGRAHQMLELSQNMEKDEAGERLFQDVRMSAIALAVGAMDAYFCDAYVDCLTSVLRAYIHNKWQGDLPPIYAQRELPAKEVLDSSREGRPLWSLRMATRKIMERDNMLSITRIKEQFNGILPSRHKLWAGLIDELLMLDSKRFTGVTRSELATLSNKGVAEAKRKAAGIFQERIKDTVQLRHDWAHNCGRPRSAIDKYTHLQAKAKIREVEALVSAFDNHVQLHRLAR